jgi:excisionase family DNA binding protein
LQPPDGLVMTVTDGSKPNHEVSTMSMTAASYSTIANLSLIADIAFIAFTCYVVMRINERRRAMSTIHHESLVHAEPDETTDLEVLRDRIEDIYRREGKALLIGPDVDEAPVEVPASAFDALKFVVEAMAEGQTIVLMPHGRVLTTQEAADLLHVSRPHVVKLCDEGKLPYERVGNRRRITIDDVLAFREARAQERREHLRELTRLSQQMEGSYR